ncbi:hypothetical protein STANM337S_01645 [Streptomyces tanashiensis]
MASYSIFLVARMGTGLEEESVEAADYMVESGFVHFTDESGSRVASFQAEKCE